jgi:hypothetical protein
MVKLKNSEIEKLIESEKEFDDKDNEFLGNYTESESNGEDFEAKSTLSFEIKEDFDKLKEKLSKSIKNGLISELAANDDSYDRTVKTDTSINTYSEEDYWYGMDRGTYETGKKISIDDNKIYLEAYETWSLGRDSYGNDDADYSRMLTIEPKKEGGCVVTGFDVNMIEDLKDFRDIFAGVRNEITYIPNSLVLTHNSGNIEKGNETKLLEDEKYKINGLQEYKNLFNSKYEHKVEFDTDKVLSIIDPSGYTVAGDINVAVYGSAEMAGPRRDVNFCHQKMNYGLDNESESLSFSDGKYPEDCYRGVTEHEGTWTDWGYETTIPEHWSRFDADAYFNKRFQGQPVSERMFDSYLKSGEKNFDIFLKTVVRQFLKNKNNGKSNEESLDAALIFIDAKNRVRQSLEKSKTMTADIKEGMVKTKESGYKHISRTPTPKKGGRED